MRRCSSSGMDKRILLYTRFPAAAVRSFDGPTRFRRSVGSCFLVFRRISQNRCACNVTTRPIYFLILLAGIELYATPCQALQAWTQNFQPVARLESMPKRSRGAIPLSWHRLKVGGYSCRTTLSREVSTCSPPLYLMKPSFLNLFMKKLTRERVVPIISARVSCDILATIF